MLFQNIWKFTTCELIKYALKQQISRLAICRLRNEKQDTFFNNRKYLPAKGFHFSYLLPINARKVNKIKCLSWKCFSVYSLRIINKMVIIHFRRKETSNRIRSNTKYGNKRIFQQLFCLYSSLAQILILFIWILYMN